MTDYKYSHTDDDGDNLRIETYTEESVDIPEGHALVTLTESGETHGVQVFVPIEDLLHFSQNVYVPEPAKGILMFKYVKWFGYDDTYSQINGTWYDSKGHTVSKDNIDDYLRYYSDSLTILVRDTEGK